MADQHLEPIAFGEKHYFLIRRLHSLLGLVPVGVFLCFHLLANATILAPGVPGAEYQKGIELIHALGPLLVPVEIVFIFLPLGMHAILGVAIALTGKSNTQAYPYGPNIRYFLQRITAYIALAFILYHLWQLHWLGASVGGGAFELHSEDGSATGAVTTAAAIQASWWIAPFYVVGVLASVFHLANGIWTSLITWGITIRARTQQVSGYVCAILGVVLALAGVGAVSGFRTFDVDVAAHDATVVATERAH